MSNRSLLIVALVALAVCAYLYFKGGEPGTRQREEEAIRLVLLEQDQIQRIELTNPSGTYVFQKAGEKKWDIEKPIKYPADPAAIDTLLSEVEFNQKLRIIAPSELKDYQASLQQFGLKDPRITARFQTSKEVVDLQIGNKTPAGNLFYALVRDAKKQDLAVVDDAIEGQLNQNLDMWRNRQVFDFHIEETTAISLRRGAQEVEVLRDGKIWNITKPLQEVAVEKNMEDYLALLEMTRAESFVSEAGGDPAQYGLNTPSFIIEVKTHGGSQVLRVGKAKADQPGQIYAQFGDRPAIFTLSQKQADEIGGLLDEIRPRELFNLTASTKVRSIKITQGGSTILLEGKEEEPNSWTVSGDGAKRKANGLGVTDMIQAMHILQGRTFYSSVDNPNAEYGLQAPIIVVDVAGYDSTQKDKTFARKVQLGAAKDNLVYAQSSALPFVVDVDRRFVTAFPKGAAGWFDRPVGLPAADEITGLTWTQGSNVLVLEKGADNQWVSNPPGKNIDPKFLKMQLAYLSGLNSLRWSAKASKKDFAKPRFVLDLKAGEHSRQLLFGPKQSDGTTLAKMSDDDYTFILSDEDAQKIMVRPVVGEPLAPVAPANHPGAAGVQ